MNPRGHIRSEQFLLAAFAAHCYGSMKDVFRGVWRNDFSFTVVFRDYVLLKGLSGSREEGLTGAWGKGSWFTVVIRDYETSWLDYLR